MKSKRFYLQYTQVAHLLSTWKTHIAQEELTLINLVWISPSDATSWWVRTYLSHLDRAFSLGAVTLMALGRFGCMTVSNSKLVVGLWSTHLSPPAECERLCRGRTGGTVYSIKTQAQSDKQETVFRPVVALVCTQHYTGKLTWRFCYTCLGKLFFIDSTIVLSSRVTDNNKEALNNLLV